MNSSRKSQDKRIATKQSKQEHRRLAAIMFTDIVGYTALTQANERIALDLLEEHRRIIRPIIKQYGGREIKTVGDSFLVEFQSALEAANCAVSIQKTLTQRNQTIVPAKMIQVRIGLHLGDVMHRGGDVYGDAVNIASRIEPFADPGGICLSGQVNDQIYNKIGLPIESVGRHRLKNVGRGVELYKLQISEEGPIEVGEASAGRCAWCSRPLGASKIPYDLSEEAVYFDTQDCLVTYRKLKGVYGEFFH